MKPELGDMVECESYLLNSAMKGILVEVNKSLGNLLATNDERKKYLHDAGQTKQTRQFRWFEFSKTFKVG